MFLTGEISICAVITKLLGNLKMTDCCTRGSLHEHTAAASSLEVKIGGVVAYVATPSAASSKCVVIVSDVFGWQLPNVRVIADKMAAEHGIMTIVPDFLDGDALPLDAFNSGFTPELKLWFERHGDAEAICGVLGRVIADAKTTYGVSKVGVQGYCWGARFAILACGTGLASGEALADAFAVAHPTRVAVPKDIEALTRPGIFLCAEIDEAFTPENVAESKAITAAKTAADAKLAFEFKHYPGTKHGFAVRGDDSTLEARNDALAAGCAFFHRVL